MTKTKTQVTVGPFKMSKTAAKEWEKLEKATEGMESAEKLAYVASYEANKAMKKKAVALKRKMKNLRQGKVSRPKAPKFSTADGSDYDRIRIFNAIVRHGGFG
jgi:biotin-(acetyl-CoA carboxylase) ligase